jgi:hypothetical protein
VESHSRRVRSTPMNGHRQTGPTGPFRAISGLMPAQQYVQSLPFFASALAGSLGRSADLPHMQLIVFHHILKPIVAFMERNFRA